MKIIAYFILIFSLVSCSKNDSIVLDCRLNYLWDEGGSTYTSPNFDAVTAVIDRSNQSIIIKNRRKNPSQLTDELVCDRDQRVVPDGFIRCFTIDNYFKSSNQDWEETTNYFKVRDLQVDRRTLQISSGSTSFMTLECIKSDDRKI